MSGKGQPLLSSNMSLKPASFWAREDTAALHSAALSEELLQGRFFLESANVFSLVGALLSVMQPAAQTALDSTFAETQLLPLPSEGVRVGGSVVLDLFELGDCCIAEMSKAFDDLFELGDCCIVDIHV